ncbi:MAG: PspA/IM30 family protein [Bacillus sp. (in: firmicutes)]
MKNLFSRIKYSVTADIHELLDNKEQKNPLAMLNQYLRECERETEKVRGLFERQARLKEEFTREYNEAKQMAKKRAHQVEVASQAGEVELYDFVLAEKNQYEERAERLREAADAAAKQLNELERKYAEMKHKLKDMHLKRLEIMGRENVARANYRMSKVLDADQAAANKSYARFDEMENYLNRLEDQVNTNYYRNTVDARIAELEKQAKNNESDLIS